MIAALSKVLRAPGLILLVFGAQLILALFVGSSVRSAVGAGLGRYEVLADGHLFGAFAQLLAEQPAVFGASRQLLAGSAFLSLVLWALLAAGIIERLRGPLPMSELVAAGLRGLPGIVVVTLWHLIPRAVLLFLGAMIAGQIMARDTWGWLGLVFLAAVFGFTTCALDLARCNVVLHGAPRFHPMTAFAAFLQPLRQPGVLVSSLVMSLAQWACVLAILAISISGFGDASTPWIARGLALLGVVFGLSRIAVAVDAEPPVIRAAAPEPAAPEPVAPEPVAPEPAALEPVAPGPVEPEPEPDPPARN